LCDIRRAKLGVRDLVTALEQAVIAFLSEFGLAAEADPKAPGVYVSGEKIASLGLKISRGSSYHGLALNINPDLEHFGRINPCGYAGLRVTSLAQLLAERCPSQADAGARLVEHLRSKLPLR
jgi:lipoyl(octanoyl) transferase